MEKLNGGENRSREEGEGKGGRSHERGCSPLMRRELPCQCAASPQARVGVGERVATGCPHCVAAPNGLSRRAGSRRRAGQKRVALCGCWPAHRPWVFRSPWVPAPHTPPAGLSGWAGGTAEMLVWESLSTPLQTTPGSWSTQSWRRWQQREQGQRGSSSVHRVREAAALLLTPCRSTRRRGFPLPTLISAPGKA